VIPALQPEPADDIFASNTNIGALFGPHWVPGFSSRESLDVEGVVTWSTVTHEDAPFDHRSHDWNFDVLLDNKYEGLIGPGNAESNGRKLMEMEWETLFFPPTFWPEVGVHFL
jgi:hypothetical protein